MYVRVARGKFIRAFSDVEKPFNFSDLVALKRLKPPNQKINKAFQRQRRLGLGVLCMCVCVWGGGGH